MKFTLANDGRYYYDGVVQAVIIPTTNGFTGIAALRPGMYSVPEAETAIEVAGTLAAAYYLSVYAELQALGDRVVVETEKTFDSKPLKGYVEELNDFMQEMNDETDDGEEE